MAWNDESKFAWNAPKRILNYSHNRKHDDIFGLLWIKNVQHSSSWPPPPPPLSALLLPLLLLVPSMMCTLNSLNLFQSIFHIYRRENSSPSIDARVYCVGGLALHKLYQFWWMMDHLVLLWRLIHLEFNYFARRCNWWHWWNDTHSTLLNFKWEILMLQSLKFRQIDGSLKSGTKSNKFNL